MVIISDNDEDQKSFNAFMDSLEPLGSLDMFESGSPEMEIMSVSKINESIRAEEPAKMKERSRVREEAGKAEEKEGKKVNKSNKLTPNKANGLDMEGYSWGQSLQDVTVTVPVLVGTKSRDVLCEVKRKSLKVGLKGQTPVIEGELLLAVKCEDSFWTLEDNKTISVLLTKCEKTTWWKSLLKGSPEIDILKAEPEPSKLSELDQETRAKVEKVMFDENQKHKGLPTSQEMETQEMIDEYLAQNPIELQSSNANMM